MIRPDTNCIGNILPFKVDFSIKTLYLLTAAYPLHPKAGCILRELILALHCTWDATGKAHGPFLVKLHFFQPGIECAIEMTS